MITISAHDILNNSGDRLAIPVKVELVENNLIFNTEASMPVRDCQQSLLSSFVQLADADSETIYIFSSRYGALDLCKDHNLPRCHHLKFRYDGSVNPTGSCQRSGIESIEAWRNWAHKFRSTLRIVSKLSNRRPGDRGDWDLVLLDLDFGNESFSWDDIEGFDILVEKQLLGWLINRYLNLGGIRLQFSLLELEDYGIQPLHTIEGSTLSLFSVLVLQLVSKISRFTFKEEVDCYIESAG